MSFAAILVGLLALSLALFVLPSFAQVYDVASDFSPTSNPSGTWSYGWSAQLTSALDLFSFSVNDRGIDIWSDSDVLYPPTVSHNGTAETITLNPETIVYQPGQFALHPGPGGEYSHARWTAPVADTYGVIAEFTGIDQTGTTTDVHILHNTSPLFAGSINGFGDTSSFSTAISLSGGDVIDFAVGYGTGGYWDDTTALSATIITGIDAVDDDLSVQNLTRFVEIYPNPFNPQTAITFSLEREEWVAVGVYEVTGRCVMMLADRSLAAGPHTLTWNGRDSQGRAMSSGNYLVRLETESGVEARKITLVR